VLARIAGQQVAERFIKMLRSLHALNRRVTEAVSLEFVREQAAKGARQLQRDAYDALRWKAVGEAAEGITVHHPGFLAVVDREAADVARLGEDAAFLARHGLASVDPDPLLYTSVRTGRRTGLGSGRSPFVDLAVLFRCVGTDGRTRYLVKIRGQSKVNMVAQLVSDVDLTGKLVLGQLARDELRKGRGAWRFMEVSIEARDLLQDPRSTTLVTFGARDLTSEEIVRHRLLDGIRVEHLVHDVSSADLYRWADELLRLLRVTRAP
jgi:hypothetical protein